MLPVADWLYGLAVARGFEIPRAGEQRFTIDRDFDLSYRPVSGDSDNGDVALDEGESQVGYYEGDGLQLSEVITEQSLLWLPMRWICSEECKGICPACGGNRNRVVCGCQPEKADHRWSALRNYRPLERL